MLLRLNGIFGFLSLDEEEIHDGVLFYTEQLAGLEGEFVAPFMIGVLRWVHHDIVQQTHYFLLLEAMFRFGVTS